MRSVKFTETRVLKALRALWFVRPLVVTAQPALATLLNSLPALFGPDDGTQLFQR